MKRTTGIVLGLALALGTGGAWFAAPAHADDMDRTRDMDRMHDMDQDREMIYGSQLMTEQERNAYHERIRMAKTEEEREQIRAEHHKEMLARAKERGVTLPEEPPMKGGGKGMGPGMGGGMGGHR